ncbi:MULTISPECIES: beta-phosphoglucomutase [Kosmotoga]|uniref:Beta-phosphoglucomutase n=1 Tax=Kosmotoga olearia (strain ATCC BAA-1733 / DSM 21960 / TBF 19.5.1) TaxID=521045 RepID=C5CHJ0_KOSOT|nr:MULTISPECIES: beta-phosphoglucomutase [Kosmotoga]ACR79745.1 beta-phosphoglucomutase [Kosmotoga olearia TBF 19.5.1]
MSFSVCIFDMDGVIVDTARYHFLAWKKLAGELGFELSPELGEQLKGIGRLEALNIVLKFGSIKANEKDKQKLAKRKNNYYLEFISKIDESEVLPGVITFLKTLREAKLKTALATVSKNASVIIEKTGIEKLFDVIVDGNMIKNGKPDPEVFLKAAEMLEVSPQECIVFEDAVAGIEAAHRAGMKCIGIGNPSVLSKADFVIRNLKEINLGVLEKVPSKGAF